MEVINAETGETVVFEPDENGVITIPAGEWRVKETAVIPGRVATRLLGNVHESKIKNNVWE